MPPNGQSPVALNGIPRATIHELRTPLTSIRGYAQLLQRGVRSPEQAQRAYDTIFRESERLAGMLDQLSRVAELNLAADQPDDGHFDLVGLARNIVEQSRARWPGREIAVRERDSTEIAGDPQRFGDVLRILLENAATYSPPDSPIEVTVGQRGNKACVSVRDEGIGVPSDELESIFECFRRGSNVSQAAGGGARGLGVSLYLARTAAVRAGGRLWAERREGHGSTFYLELPLAP